MLHVARGLSNLSWSKGKQPSPEYQRHRLGFIDAALTRGGDDGDDAFLSSPTVVIVIAFAKLICPSVDVDGESHRKQPRLPEDDGLEQVLRVRRQILGLTN